jgi:hypothetical protein
MRFFYSIMIICLLCGCKKEFLSSDKALLDFTIQSKDNPALSADIHGDIINDTVTFILPSDTMSKKLVATVTVSEGARVIPGNKEEKDFTRPVLYTVAAPNGTVKNYIVVCKPKTSLKTIVSFKLEKSANPQLPVDVFASIVHDTVKIRIPEGTSATLLPVITVNSGASIVNAIASADFNTPVHYTIKAEDGSTKTVVTKLIFVAPPKLKSFAINNGCGAYVKSTNTFYFPVPLGTTFNSYTVTYDTTAARFVKFDVTDVVSNKPANFPLSTNQTVKIQAYDEFNRSESYNLIITGMPVVQLKTDADITDVNLNAQFTLTDGDYQTHKGAWFVKTNIAIKIRGATSRFYPKFQYAVSMRDDSYAKTDKQLLGLRTDEDWILDAMFIDQGRMRNRLSTDIWNSMNNVPYINKEPAALNGTRGYMVEVFKNNEYLGVFCLTEKLDRKQLKVKKATGMVYKAENWGVGSLFIDAPAYNNSSDTWEGWEFDYPEIGDKPAPDWKPIANFANFVATSTDADFTSQISSKVYVDNMVDYLIFINAVTAIDNYGKNTFFSFYDSNADPKFFYSAWDLDATFGRSYDGTYFQKTYPEYYFLAYNNNLLIRLLNVNPDNFRGKLKARWNVLKNNQLSKSVVNARIEAFRKQLVLTNAGARELARWPLAQDFNTEANYMTNWYNSHYDWLDGYINSL